MERLKLQPGHARFLPVLLNQRLICWWDLNEAAPQGKLMRLLPQPGPAPWWPRPRKGAGPRLSGVMAFFPLGASSRGTCLTVFKAHLTLELPPAFPQTRSPPVHLPPRPSSIWTVRHHGPRGEAPASEPENVKPAPATCWANGPIQVQLQEPFL